jgi:hypothetical protein
MSGTRRRHDADKPLPDSEIERLARRVADGTATPDQAQRLLIEVVRYHEHGAHAPPLLIEHVADCLAVYLRGKRKFRRDTLPVRSLEKAFGLVPLRPVGKPRIDEGTHLDVAINVLEIRLRGQSLEDAAAAVAGWRHAKGLPLRSESQVRAAWSKCKREAVSRLDFYREVAGDSPVWSDEEIKRLKAIYRDVPDIVLPTTSQSKRRRPTPPK